MSTNDIEAMKEFERSMDFASTLMSPEEFRKLMAMIRKESK